MGKILVYSEKYSNDFSDFDFLTKSKEISCEFGNVIAYKKIRIDTKNFASFDDNWIIGTGTYIYDGKKDSDALLSILYFICKNKEEKIFSTITELRNLIYGSYCLFVKFNGKYYCFVDNMGSYKVYYHLSDNDKNIMLTNTWYHVAKYANLSEVNDEKFVEYLCKVDIVSQKTPVNGIQRLLSNETLIYSGVDWNIKTLEVETSPIKNDFWNKMKNAYIEIGKAFSKQGIFYTGGQDSRMNLALFMGSGIKPKLFYGIGNTRETNTKSIDKDIFYETAEKLSLDTQIMNWNDTNLENLDDFIIKLGEYATIYVANKNIFNEFNSKIDVDCLSLGYFGEYLRNNEFEIPSEVTLSEYIKLFYETNIMKDSCKNLQLYIRDFESEISKILNFYHLDVNNIKQNDLTILNYVMKKNIDTRMCNYVNMFMYSYMLVPNFELYRMAFSVQYNTKLNSAFILRGINDLYPAALEIPLYSHHTLRKINKDNLSLEYKSSKIENLRKVLITSRIYTILKHSFVRSLYFILKGDKKGLSEYKAEKELMHTYWNKIDCDLVRKNFNMRKLKLAADGTFITQLYIILKLLKCSD